jgi:hypothetical protein
LIHTDSVLKLLCSSICLTTSLDYFKLFSLLPDVGLKSLAVTGVRDEGFDLEMDTEYCEGLGQLTSLEALRRSTDQSDPRSQTTLTRLTPFTWDEKTGSVVVDISDLVSAWTRLTHLSL